MQKTHVRAPFATRNNISFLSQINEMEMAAANGRHWIPLDSTRLSSVPGSLSAALACCRESCECGLLPMIQTMDRIPAGS